MGKDQAGNPLGRTYKLYLLQIMNAQVHNIVYVKKQYRKEQRHSTYAFKKTKKMTKSSVCLTLDKTVNYNEVLRKYKILHKKVITFS